MGRESKRFAWYARPQAGQDLLQCRRCNCQRRHNRWRRRMARQVHANRPSKCKKVSKKQSRTHMPGTIQHIVELVPKMPSLLGVLIKLDGEKRRPLRPRPCIPMSLVRVVVHKGSITAVLPLLVVLGNVGQIPILVHVVRKNEKASLGRVAKAVGRRRWECAQ
jgi:hypothetical protein